jgi:hypothetical protein
MGAMAHRPENLEQAADGREPESHCPFLNRTDERCSTHFRLDHLQQTFQHCFDRYHACPVYRELLVERRLRRTTASAVLQVRSAMADGDGGFDPAADAGWAWERQLSRSVPVAPAAHVPSPLVPLTVARRTHRPVAQRVAQRTRTRPYAHALPAAAGAGVPAAPRV